MTKEEFIELLIETIDTEDEINENTLLDEIEEYDSIAILILLFGTNGLSSSSKPDSTPIILFSSM
jgi:hypothetical protein